MVPQSSSMDGIHDKHPAIGLASAIKNPPGPDTSSNQTPSNGIWPFGWPKALDFLGNHFDALSESPCGQQNFSAHRKGQPYLFLKWGTQNSPKRFSFGETNGLEWISVSFAKQPHPTVANTFWSNMVLPKKSGILQLGKGGPSVGVPQ